MDGIQDRGNAYTIEHFLGNLKNYGLRSALREDVKHTVNRAGNALDMLVASGAYLVASTVAPLYRLGRKDDGLELRV